MKCVINGEYNEFEIIIVCVFGFCFGFEDNVNHTICVLNRGFHEI
jgi:hypothetical protein